MEPWSTLMIWRRAWSGFSFNAPECFLVSDGEMEKRWHGAGFRVPHLGNIRQMLIHENLSIELYFGKVESLATKSGIDIAEFITKNVKPQSIGWSNVIDYFLQRDLHDLGRAISSHGMVTHFAYSMNWTAEVFRANIDYNMIKDFNGANKIVDLAHGENFGGLNPLKINLIRDSSEVSNELFHCPDLDTPMNSTEFVATQMMRPCTFSLPLAREDVLARDWTHLTHTASPSLN